MIFALALAALATAPFAQAVHYPFLAWDGGINFVANPNFRGLGAQHLHWMWSSFHAGHYMPLTWMSCALDFAVAGLDPAQFHATNIACHSLTALILYLVLVELLERSGVTAELAKVRLAAAAAALFFALHPLRVESVVWVTERRDVLSGVFFALSIWCWLRSQREGASRAAVLSLSMASFAASLLSKVSGVALPVVLLALDAWPLRRNARRGCRFLWIEKLPYFAFAVAGATSGYIGQRDGAQVLETLDERSIVERVPARRASA